MISAHQQVLSLIAKINRIQQKETKTEIAQSVFQVQTELDEIKKQYKSQTTQMQDEKEKLQQQQATLELEKSRLQDRHEELLRRESKLAAFEEQCRQWQQRLEFQETLEKGEKESQELLHSIREKKEEVEFLRRDLLDKMALAERARIKLESSKLDLKQRVKSMEKYLELVEHKETVHFRKLLNATKHLLYASHPKVKCFVSYAWQPDPNDNVALQTQLLKIKADLKKAGIHVMLDICNMEGDINRYMLDGIQQCDRVLLVSFFSFYL